MLVAFMVICSLVEISLSFFEAVIFGFGEIVNMCVAYCISDETKPVFNSSKQIVLLVVLASFMGAVEGLVFGSLDAEDDVYLRDQFNETNDICIPLGGCVGALLGLINESLRHLPEQN